MKEAHEQQAATAEILKVIASSPDDVQPVFEAIATSAKRLLGGFTAAVFRLSDGAVHLAAFTPTNLVADEALRADFPKPVDAFEPLQLTRPGEPFPIPDTEKIPYAPIREIARLHGFRAMLFVPLMNGGLPIGVISVTRAGPGAFPPHHIQLLQTFADQAVIAVQNTRLFNETKEALERQTATAEILKVIASSPSDVQPVFDAIASSSKQLIGGFSATVFRFVDGIVNLVAYTPVSPAADQVLKASFPRPTANLPFFELAKGGEVVQEADCETNPDAGLRDLARARGFRSSLFSPLMSQGTPMGLIVVTRKEPGPFAAHHVQLLETFADQAVIAIQNVELFEEVQAKTRDLEESLQQQTATADVLKVISRSAFDLQTVLHALTESAARLCKADMASITRKGEGGDFYHVTNYSFPPDWMEYARKHPFKPGRGSVLGRSLIEKRAIQVVDVLADPEYVRGEQQKRAGFRTVLAVPLQREGEPIGVFILCSKTVSPFDEKQIELISGFADQAVIAIENVRLFDELQAKTRDLQESLEQQTATAEILSSISGSMNDTQPVFDAIVRNLLRLFGTRFAVVQSLDQGIVEMPAVDGEPGFERLRERYPRPLAHDTVGGIAMLEKRTLQFHPVLGNAAAPITTQQFAHDFGFNSVLFNPMLSGDKVVGAIGVARHDAVPFDDKQIALIASFANQAVIAIENTRLLRELQERTDALTRSLDDLRAAQDRLVQTEKLASLGQLTAGIAHEIKNPLNFVNNFSALSVELTDELNDVLKQAELAEKIKQEVTELTQLLKSNLEKIVQHGKRADSIVKNMLLHSREGSREHRPADINSLLDESLNLAYHGARAEKGEFDITLQRDFDANAGTIELFPQEITRAFLNLIANGVYAATKRKTEQKEPGFEPTLQATTKNLGATVEIRIRDNGTGIPAEVREKMFNPFFTTKPAGEGTGLGLSMTHDIIVKQHGGRIDVATEAGQFTEFTIVLPRKSNLSGVDRGKT